MAYQTPTLPTVDVRGAMQGLMQANQTRGALPGQLLSQYQDRVMKEEALAAEQSNREKEYLLRKANAERQAKQDEYNMLMKSAQMGQQADYQQSMLEKQTEAQKAAATQNEWLRKFKNDERSYTRGMDQGEILGASMPVEEYTMQDKTIQVPTADAKEIMSKEQGKLLDTVGLTNDEKKQMYLKYLKKNDPIAYKEYTKEQSPLDVAGEAFTGGDFTDKLLNAPKEVLSSPYNVTKMVTDATIMPVVRTVADYLTDSSSQADKDFTEPKLKEGVQTRDEFVAELDAADKEAKASVKEFTTPGSKLFSREYAKEVGAIEDKITPTAVRKDENTIKAEVNDKILTYAKKNNLSQNHPKILGMYKAANAKMDKILTTRAATDKMKIERAYKEMDAAQKYQFDLQLATLKDQLGRIPTPKEEAKMKLDLVNAQLKEQELKDAKGWWD